MLRLRYASVVLVAALGCSPIKDHSNVPDAPIDSMDMRPPMIESSSPANMGTKVSIVQPVSVFFDESLDPASVSNATVKLAYFANLTAQFYLTGDYLKPHGPVPASGMQLVKGSVSYDEAGKKISFVPAAPLQYGYVYTLTMNVKDKAGLDFTGSITFTTYVNLQTKQYNYNSSGIPTSWLGTPTDMNGRMAKRVVSTAPGTDTVWFTSDDPRSSHIDMSLTPEGQPLFEKVFQPGTDTQYDTPDDVANVCWSYRYDSQKQITERTYSSSAGPDAMLCTGDDVPTYNYKYDWMGTTLAGYVWYTAPGTDNTWRTTDDKCSVWWEYIYDAAGLKTREIYHDCGTDGLPRTADDGFGYYYDYQYDADTNLIKTTEYGGPGTDNMWLTSDDAINFVDRLVRNADGQITDRLYSYGPGTDMTWGTPDDAGYRYGYTYTQKLTDTVTYYNSPGTDGMFGTSDDLVYNYTLNTYDANGNRIDSRVYYAGADGMAKTPDDRIQNDYDFDVGR